MTEIFCTQDLAEMLQDQDVTRAGILRQIYITARPMGSVGATGKMQQGDLAEDLTAKIICYDPLAKSYSVTRNGNPSHPEEHVPGADIAALIRSFVRDNAAFGPTYVTVTDTDMQKGRGIETIRMVIPANQIEYHCVHKPRESGGSGGGGGTVISSRVAFGLAALTLAICIVYYKYFRVTAAEHRHSESKALYVDNRRDGRSVREALDRLRV